jgi:hypothetical protein
LAAVVAVALGTVQEIEDGFSGFLQLCQCLQADPGLATEIAARLLESHFPESIHADILAAVGLTLGT